MELGLSVEADRTLYGERQGGLPGKRGVNPQRGRGTGLLPHRVVRHGGIEIGGPIFKRAVDALRLHHAAVFLNGPGVGAGVLPGRLLTQGLNELGIDEPVLGGNLGGGVFGLAAAQAAGLHALLPELPGRKHAGHTAANDGRLHL